MSSFTFNLQPNNYEIILLVIVVVFPMKFPRLACCFGVDRNKTQISSSGNPPALNDVKVSRGVGSQPTDYNQEAQKIFSILKDDPDSDLNHRDLDVIWYVINCFRFHLKSILRYGSGREHASGGQLFVGNQRAASDLDVLKCVFICLL